MSTSQKKRFWNRSKLLTAGLLSLCILKPASALPAQESEAKIQTLELTNPRLSQALKNSPGKRVLRLNDRFPLKVRNGRLSQLFSEDLIDPEFVVKNADEIGINQQKRARIIDYIVEARAQITRLELTNDGSDDAIDAILEKAPINKPAALDALDRLLNNERAIKRVQLELMISTRNELSEDEFASYKQLQYDQFQGPFTVQFKNLWNDAKEKE